MPLEDQLRTAINRALAENAGQLERVLQSFAVDLAAAAAEERRLRAAETDRLLAEATATAQQRVDAAMALESERLQRLAQAIRRLDAARSLVDLLDALAQAAAHEADRVALFVTNQSHLQGWRVYGFDDQLVARSIDLDAEAAGALGAVTHDHTGVARHLTAAETLPSFIGSAHGRERAVVPVIVDGTVVAVLYADAAAIAGAPAHWPALLELLARHAGRALEALTLQRVAGLSPLAAASSSTIGANAGGSPS